MTLQPSLPTQTQLAAPSQAVPGVWVLRLSLVDALAARGLRNSAATLTYMSGRRIGPYDLMAQKLYGNEYLLLRATSVDAAAGLPPTPDAAALAAAADATDPTPSDEPEAEAAEEVPEAAHSPMPHATPRPQPVEGGPGSSAQPMLEAGDEKRRSQLLCIIAVLAAHPGCYIPAERVVAAVRLRANDAVASGVADVLAVISGGCLRACGCAIDSVNLPAARGGSIFRLTVEDAGALAAAHAAMQALAASRSPTAAAV